MNLTYKYRPKKVRFKVYRVLYKTVIDKNFLTYKTESGI